MANIKSQIKRNRQMLVRNARNKSVRSELKTRAKAVATAAAEGDNTATEAAYREAQKKFDMAVSKGVMKKQTAARRKSRLAKKLS